LRRLIRHPVVLGAGAWLLGLYLAFVYRTTRWDLRGYDPAAACVHADGAVILAFWHENLPLMPWVVLECRKRGLLRRGHVLVSHHRDGVFIGRAVARFHVELAYGSSSRGGAAGIIALARLVNSGESVAITPDGPRGPRRRAAAGVAELAASTGKSVVPIAGRTRFAVGIRSWDRMEIPLPFSRAFVVAGPPIAVPPGGGEAALPLLEAAMDAAADAADAAVGKPRR
jgi:hypothetical protein